MARPIICGVDDSDSARAAVRVAREVSDRLREALMLVQVAPADVPAGTSVVSDAPLRLLERERRDAESLLPSARST